MKKVLLSLLAVAALVLSCQNYDDEFAALNTKIASLESQITSLAELRTAVTGVQSSISALQSAVAAAQAAAEAADNADAISALATSVAAIAADLVDLQTAIDGATTEADLSALKEELNTTLAALQALIESNSASIANLVASNADLKSALEELGVDVDSVLASNATFEGNLTITNAAELAYAKSLGNKVATIKGDVYVKIDENTHTGGGTGLGLSATDVNSVLSQITYIVGNLKIDSDAGADLSSLTSISGDYIVMNSDVSDDKLTSVGGDVFFDYDGAYISNIEKASNIYLVMKGASDATTTVPARLGTASIDFSAITTASSIQSVSSSEATSHTSGSSLTFSTPEQDKTLALNAATTSVKIGQVPVVSVSGTKVTTIDLAYRADYSTTNTTGSSHLASLTVSGASLTSVKVGANNITGATSITMKTTGVTSLDMSVATAVGSISTNASSVDFTALKTAKGITLSQATSASFPALTASTLGITLTKATTMSFPKLAALGTKSSTTGAITSRVNLSAPLVTGAISLPALTYAGDLSFAEGTSLSAILADVNNVTLNADATSVDLGNLNTGLAQIATLKTINLHNQKKDVYAGIIADYSGAYATVDISESLDLTSAAAATSITILGNSSSVDVVFDLYDDLTKLTKLTLGGKLGEVDVYDSPAASALATIITSGTIYDFRVENNADLATLTLGHADDAVLGATLTVIDNDKVTAIETNIDRATSVVITGNDKLASIDLSSLTTLPNNFASVSTWTFTVTGNFVQGTGTTDVLSRWSGLTGTFTAESSSVERSYGQSSLATLKPYIQLLYNKAYPATGSATVTDTSIDIDLNYKVSDPTTSASATATVLLSTTQNFTTPSNAEGTTFNTGASGSADLKNQFLEVLKLQ